VASPATAVQTLDLVAPGSRIVVRDQDWQVIGVERHAMGTRAIVRCIGRSELVRDQPASFFSDLDLIEPEDPTQTTFRLDKSANGTETLLILESLIRRTPIPVSNVKMTVGHLALADDLPFQREPFRMAMSQLQPRLLIADAVGLGKTIEVGMMLTELQRRGRAERVLCVVPRHILDQIQHELWCRFAFPLVRLDSEGIQRVRQRIPAGRNPFTYFNRVIISIDTLKNPGRYRPHLERVRWNAIWIDESHKLVNKNTLNNELAKVLAPNTDALILTSATPHNGKPESFAELVSLLDPTAVPDPDEVTAADIAHLVVRRHRHSPDVEAVIQDQWAERAKPLVVPVTPSAEEEAVFAEISRMWLNPEVSPPGGDPLFSYTLLKAALSSPSALVESVERRMKRRTALTNAPVTTAIDLEFDALTRLWAKAQEAVVAQSAKLTALVEILRHIGVGSDSNVRVVIFSERIRTLGWIAESLQREMGMNPGQVQTFHNSKSDEEQQEIIEAFSMESAPLRVLVTSDIASEGVNLHKQCNHLIHFDLPWSLITLEQRNGRIDRYGQVHPPEVRYLVYSPADLEIASDVRIVSKLVAKEDAAHRALGDAGSIMGLYSESSEEIAIISALRKRTEAEKEAALEEVTPVAELFDPWKFAGLDSGGVAASLNNDVVVEPMPSLFGDTDAYLSEGLRTLYGDLANIKWETDGSIISFEPTTDLLKRLDALPQAYLRQRDLAGRLRLTTDKAAATLSLEYALNAKADEGSTGTAWPEVHFLGPQHPVLDWLADKLLYRIERNQAIAIPCNVEVPTVLMLGVWSNRLGEPIASAWLAATVEDGLVTFDDLFVALDQAGATYGMVNPLWEGDFKDLEADLPTVVTAVESYLSGQMEEPLALVKERLAETQRRLEHWQIQARLVADEMKSEPGRRKRLGDIERVSNQIEGLIINQTPAQSPLIRVVAALVPRG
jgi:superfamily II DNA or RNA helicase